MPTLPVFHLYYGVKRIEEEEEERKKPRETVYRLV
jgi:hypothetical protein